jgi:multiple antibiotic resistance protein
MEALALKSLLTLLVIMDPVGMVPIFLALAGNRSDAERNRIAARAVLVTGVVMLAFALGGAWLLARLDISFDAFRTSGGILLFLIAVDMVLAQHERETKEEEEESRARPDISVFPLAIPMMAGPGALASIMILASESQAVPMGLAMVIGNLALVLALCFGALRLANPLRRVLGRTGVNVITRIFGVLLAALAVQYVADGVKGLFAA